MDLGTLNKIIEEVRSIQADGGEVRRVCREYPDAVRGKVRAAVDELLEAADSLEPRFENARAVLRDAATKTMQILDEVCGGAKG